MTNLVYERLNAGPSDRLGYFVAIKVLLDGLDYEDLKEMRFYIDEILEEKEENKNNDSDDFELDYAPPF